MKSRCETYSEGCDCVECLNIGHKRALTVYSRACEDLWAGGSRKVKDEAAKALDVASNRFNAAKKEKPDVIE